MRTAGNLHEERAGWLRALRVGGAYLAIGMLGSVINPTRVMAGSIAGPVVDLGSMGDIVSISVTDYYGQYVRPACSTSGAFAFDTTTQGGRNKLAIALAAKNSGHHLGIHGTGSCDVQAGAESVGYLWEGLP